MPPAEGLAAYFDASLNARLSAHGSKFDLLDCRAHSVADCNRGWRLYRSCYKRRLARYVIGSSGLDNSFCMSRTVQIENPYGA
jgi:hypothetical protein